MLLSWCCDPNVAIQILLSWCCHPDTTVLILPSSAYAAAMKISQCTFTGTYQHLCPWKHRSIICNSMTTQGKNIIKTYCDTSLTLTSTPVDEWMVFGVILYIGVLILIIDSCWLFIYTYTPKFWLQSRKIVLQLLPQLLSLLFFGRRCWHHFHCCGHRHCFIDALDAISSLKLLLPSFHFCHWCCCCHHFVDDVAAISAVTAIDAFAAIFSVAGIHLFLCFCWYCWCCHCSLMPSISLLSWHHYFDRYWCCCCCWSCCCLTLLIPLLQFLPSLLLMTLLLSLCQHQCCHCCHHWHCCHRCHCCHVFFQCYFSLIHSPFLHHTHYHRQWKNKFHKTIHEQDAKIFLTINWYGDSEKNNPFTLMCPLAALCFLRPGTSLHAIVAFSFRIYATIHKSFCLDRQCLIQSICPGWCVTQLFSGLH